jgi:NADPH:quinone reductase-like Zn-dependent oxidoreductase
VIIDYNAQDFEEVLSGYDLVLNSQDPKTLEKSLRVLKPGGQLISISGPPDPAFAEAFGLNPLLKLVIRLLSTRVRKKAKALGVRYSFLVIRAQGQRLSEITSLIESRIARPVVDKIFPFGKTSDALAYHGQRLVPSANRRDLEPKKTPAGSYNISWETCFLAAFAPPHKEPGFARSG